MSDKHESAFVGSYDSVGAASNDFDSVGVAHHDGHVGHVEAAVLSRDSVGKLSWDRHERFGGFHLSHSPSDELVRISDQLVENQVALVVIGSSDDSAAIEHAAAGARDPQTQTIEHQSLSEGYFSGGGGAPPEIGESGFEDGSVGHLGV
jgi:hypothetical protein